MLCRESCCLLLRLTLRFLPPAIPVAPDYPVVVRVETMSVVICVDNLVVFFVACVSNELQPGEARFVMRCHVLRIICCFCLRSLEMALLAPRTNPEVFFWFGFPVLPDIPSGGAGQGDVRRHLREPPDERSHRSLLPERVGGHDARGVLLLLRCALFHLCGLLLLHGEGRCRGYFLLHCINMGIEGCC